MSLPKFMDFSANIRTHARIIGVLLIMNIMSCLLVYAALEFESLGSKPEFKALYGFKYIFLVSGVVNAILSILFWAGFIKRQRWCLTIFLGYVGLTIVLQILVILAALVQLKIIAMLFQLLMTTFNVYFFRVTQQLREANSLTVMEESGAFKV